MKVAFVTDSGTGKSIHEYAEQGIISLPLQISVDDKTYQAPAQATNAKAEPKKQLPNTGTEKSNTSLVVALLAAMTGGLLISRKRKEEE